MFISFLLLEILAVESEREASNRKYHEVREGREDHSAFIIFMFFMVDTDLSAADPSAFFLSHFPSVHPLFPARREQEHTCIKKLKSRSVVKH